MPRGRVRDPRCLWEGCTVSCLVRARWGQGSRGRGCQQGQGAVFLFLVVRGRGQRKPGSCSKALAQTFPQRPPSLQSGARHPAPPRARPGIVGNDSRGLPPDPPWLDTGTPPGPSLERIGISSSLPLSPGPLLALAFGRPLPAARPLVALEGGVQGSNDSLDSRPAAAVAHLRVGTAPEAPSSAGASRRTAG